MGRWFYDRFTLGHALSGLLAGLLIFPEEPVRSAAVVFGLHVASEGLEHPVNPETGTVLGTWHDHVGDMVAYGIGWGLARSRDDWRQRLAADATWRKVLWAILLTMSFVEVGRELWPRRFPINPAFRPKLLFGYPLIPGVISEANTP